MKIAYFITGLGLGGAEVITLDLAKKALGAGHEVIIVYLAPADELAGRAPDGIRLFPLNMRKTPGGILKALRKARRIVRDFRPDIVHSNMVHSNIFTRLLRLRVGLPVLICTEHTKNIGSRGRMLAYRLTDCLSDLNTNVSQVAVDEFVRRKAFRKRDATVMYNGVEPKRFAPDKAAGKAVRRQYGIGDNEFLWLNVGRLTEAKDQSNLVKAFKMAGQGRLMIVGQGELREALEAQIRREGLSGRVILAGAHSNVSDYYNAADCFVMSSAWEGFGIVLAEAMSCGLPVIATDAGGCAEVVQNDEYVVPVRRHDLLAEKMSRMYGLSDEGRKQIGENNRSSASKFGLDKIWEQWENIYKSLANR